MRHSLQDATRQLRQSTTAAVAIVRRHAPDYQIALYMGLLMLMGLIVMYAIGPQRANFLNNVEGTDFYTTNYFFIKQTVSLLLAMAAFAFMATIPYAFILKYAGKILLLAFAVCGLLVILGNILDIEQLTLCTKGACRWFVVPGLGTLQPAEFLKFGVLIFVAGFLGVRSQQGQINDVQRTLIPVGIIAALSMFFVILMQKDMGTGIALISILVAMLIVANIKWRVLGLVFIGLLVAGVLLIVIAPHRIDRVITFLNGDNTSVDDPSGYHISHSKIAIGTGGIAGVGIGNSIQASGYLPESINDSVFAIMGETFGFLGLTGVIAIFTALLLRLLKVTDHLNDMRMKLLVAGVFGWLASHVILNIAAMIGIFPLTGITLPLLSFGGTSMIFIAAALGLAFQISRYTAFGSKLRGNENEDSSSRRGVGRTRYASRRRPS
ncbi:FtsW/RodA/SpoVE family cell cycle protein [bacterium]|nr:MAG: FtsW/RodA/SpoVE family cell cycle protein [bacterium]